MMYLRTRVLCIPLLLFYLTAVSCTISTAPTQGFMPTRSAIDTAAKVAKAGDLAAAAVTQSVASSLRAGIITRDTAQVYATQIGPKVQASLDSLRVILQTLKTSSTIITNEQLAEGMVQVQEAVATAQSFVANPMAWVTMNGGVK